MATYDNSPYSCYLGSISTCQFAIRNCSNNFNEVELIDFNILYINEQLYSLLFDVAFLCVGLSLQAERSIVYKVELDKQQFSGVTISFYKI